MPSRDDRGLVASLLAMNSLSRHLGCGGLSPALMQALGTDLRFSPRVCGPPQSTGAGDALPENVVILRPADSGRTRTTPYVKRIL